MHNAEKHAMKHNSMMHKKIPRRLRQLWLSQPQNGPTIHENSQQSRTNVSKNAVVSDIM